MVCCYTSQFLGNGSLLLHLHNVLLPITQGFLSSNRFQLYDIIGWTNQAFKLFTPIICNDSIYTAFKSKKDSPDIYLTLLKNRYRGRCRCQISKQIIKHEIAPLVSCHSTQIGCLEKQNSPRNSNLKVSAAVFQSDLKDLQKNTQNCHYSTQIETF